MTKLSISLILVAGAAPLFAASTFHKDVLPILQKNCQACHRPGEIGPMAFLDYKGTRPWAKSIKTAVLSKKMPPWFADPRYGHFSNDRRLSETDIAKLVEWADAGAPEGSAKDGPKPLAWNEGWNLKPDLTYQLPAPYTVPKDGTIEYTYFIVPSGLTKDTWVEDAEVRAGNRTVVHHASVYIRPPGSKWLKDAPMGKAYVPQKKSPLGTHPPDEIASAENFDNEWFVGYVPGIQPQRYFAPEMSSAKFIPAGSDIVFEMHYTANGKESAADQTKVGFVVAKKLPERRLLTLGVADASFAIPPGAANYEGHASATFNQAVTVIYLQPHMHARGKDMEMRFEYPTGEKQVMLNVPNYSYLWQTIYYEKEPLNVPKDTRVDVTAHWDNSANNKLNPDPTATVRWGDQSWDEMLVPFVGVLVPRDADPKKVLRQDVKPGVNAAP